MFVRLQRMLRQMLAVQRRRAHETPLLGHGQQHGRHVQMGECHPFLEHHLEEKAKHATFVGDPCWGRRQQFAPGTRQQLVAAVAALRGQTAVFFIVR